MKNLKFLLLQCLFATAMIFFAGCASVGNNFDDSKASQIIKGQTSEADLIQMFGQPQSRSMNSEGQTILNWMYSQSAVRGESFIPYVGAFVGGMNTKEKSLNVTLQNDRVVSYSSTGGGMDTRNRTQGVPK